MELKNGYKQTDVGVIPEDWKVALVEDISEVRSGKRLPLGKSLVDNETKHPYIRVIDMFQGGVNINNIKYVPEDVFPAIKNYRIYKDDIFVSVAGTLGITGKIPIELDGANLTENANRLTNIKCNRDYLLYIFLSSLIQNKIESERTLGAQPKLALTRIRKFVIPLPPTKAEQEAIAKALSDADALIESLEKLIAKKRNIKQGTMQQLLTGKKRLPVFSGEWEGKSLFELADNSKKLFDDGDWIEAEFLTEDGIRLIQTGNIGKGIFLEKDNKKYISEESFKKLRCKEVKEGDILICRLAEPAGRACIMPLIGEYKVITAVDVSIFRPLQTMADRRYLVNVFSTNDWFNVVNEKCGGSTRTRIARGALGKIKVHLPPLPEQQAIAKVLSDMDAEIEVLEKKRDKYKMVKQGIMQELLTGKTRLI